MKIFLSPQGDTADLTNEVSAKAAALRQAADEGFRFLAMSVDNTRDAATWILASFHSPVTAIPLPPGLPLPALEARIAQLPAGSVVFSQSLKIQKPEASLPPLRPENDIWAVIFSSGSSGEAKGIALSGHALRANAEAHAIHSTATSIRWLLDLPLYHVGGLSVLSRALFLDVPLALGSPRFHAEETAAWIRSGLIQGLSLVPTTLFRLLKEKIENFSSLQLVLLGGAAAEPGLVKEAVSRGLPIRLTYGMTEHASQIATEKLSGQGLEPLPGVELRLGLDGEIMVRSACLANGFFRDGTVVSLPMENGFFHTGDLGEIQSGKIMLRGRKSEMIVTGGLKVFPLEVEKELARIPGLTDCAVTSLPDKEWGEVLCAAVVEENSGTFDSRRAKELLKKVLEARKIPRRWVCVASIPRSPTGKILRGELRSLVLDHSHS